MVILTLSSTIFDSQTKIYFEGVKKQKIWWKNGICVNKIRETFWWADEIQRNSDLLQIFQPITIHTEQCQDCCSWMENTVEGRNFLTHCHKIKRRYEGRKLNGLDLSLRKNPLLFAWQHPSKNLVNQRQKHRKFVKLWCVMYQVLNSTKPGFSKGNQLYCLHTFFYFCSLWPELPNFVQKYWGISAF